MYSKLRFAVLQPGARMHYAIPALLESAGMLQCFYTDLTSSRGVLRHLDKAWPQALRPKPVARLLGRRLPQNVPCEKVRHLWPQLARKSLTARARGQQICLYRRC